MAPSIVLFDIPCKTPGRCWSGNTWKTRYNLHFKGIPFETYWVEYPDIEEVSKQHGIPPMTLNDDGSPLYTCPAILDRSTGAAISDSRLIAEYLDKTYPDTPKILPNATGGLQIAFSEFFARRFAPGWPLIVPLVPKILNPRSVEYFIPTRTKQYGKPLEELIKTEEERVKALQEFKKGWDDCDKLYTKTDGPFLMGETISWGDVLIASNVHFLAEVWGEESENWKIFRTWSNGKWVMLRDELDRCCKISVV